MKKQGVSYTPCNLWCIRIVAMIKNWWVHNLVALRNDWQYRLLKTLIAFPFILLYLLSIGYAQEAVNIKSFLSLPLPLKIFGGVMSVLGYYFLQYKEKENATEVEKFTFSTALTIVGGGIFFGFTTALLIDTLPLEALPYPIRLSDEAYVAAMALGGAGGSRIIEAIFRKSGINREK